MRKSIMAPHSEAAEQDWLDLEELARVEITSEEPSHPIESALQPGAGAGWSAARPGPQKIRIVFDQPQTVRRIQLLIIEENRARTQELTLRWSKERRGDFRELVRQQYNFAPPDTTREQEEYKVDLAGVTALELEIVPDLSRSDAKASLARLRVG
jgi:hypothetical protein